MISDRIFPGDRLLSRDTFFDPGWFLGCDVSILVVTDSSSGGFGETAGFHLGLVLDILSPTVEAA